MTVDQLVVHALPEGVPTHDSFTIQVRVPGGEWTAVPVRPLSYEIPVAVAGDTGSFTLTG